jgi:hypothetical protein
MGKANSKVTINCVSHLKYVEDSTKPLKFLREVVFRSTF